MEIGELFFYAIVCLILSAFFSGMEIAYLKSDKLRTKLMYEKGSFIGRIQYIFQTNKSKFLATVLIGNNLVLVIYGIYMAKILEPLIYNYFPVYFQSDIFLLITQSIISTGIVLVTGEFLPKSLFLINPNVMLSFFSLPMAFIYYLIKPFVFFVESFTKFLITRIFNFKFIEEEMVYGITDLSYYLSNYNFKRKNTSEKIDTTFLQNAIELKETKVKDCMIPRTEIVAIDINSDIQDLKKALLDSGHSKILVYKNNIDNVIGYCHCLELFKKPKSIKDIYFSIPIVHETMLASELFVTLTENRKSLALVVDEFGGTSGIVTVEDVIEEIFGEIRDEHDDDENLIEIKQSPTEYILTGRHEIDYLNEKYLFDLPEGEYDTLAGMILQKTQDLPKVNDVVDFKKFVIEILSMSNNKIEKVKLIINSQTTID